MVEAYRRDLARTAGARRPRAVRVSRPVARPKVTHHPATGLPVSDGRAVRGVVRPKVGSWLIRAGTRLGGASMRTS